MCRGGPRDEAVYTALSYLCNTVYQCIHLVIFSTWDSYSKMFQLRSEISLRWSVMCYVCINIDQLCQGVSIVSGCISCVRAYELCGTVTLASSGQDTHSWSVVGSDGDDILLGWLFTSR